jgi:lipopolysaccharide export system protein LptC
MNPAPLKLVTPSGQRPEPRVPASRKRAPTPERIARRRWMVMITKRVLPVIALALLTSIALWPEIGRDARNGHLGDVSSVEAQSGLMTQARYNGVDTGGRPYTVTAVTARQSTPDRIDLTSPVGDMTLANGTWLRGEGKVGVYMQQEGQLDLTGNVTLYRDDGITLQTDTATLDVKQGAASTADRVHVEGPFGTLDAQGFTVLDHGTLIRFAGPGRLLLNGSSK